MIEGYNIICFAPSDWWAMNPSCTTHIMQKLAAKNKVLYINPFSSDFLGMSKRGITARLARKLKSITKFLKKIEKNFYVFSPIFLPFQGKRYIDLINNALLKTQIKFVCFFLHMSKPILWIENLRAADMIEWFKPTITVYHVSDLFEECSYSSNRQILYKREREAREKSDILICVSKKLYDAKATQRNNVFYLPHGVDFDLFHKAANNNNSIKELADIPRPIAGYYGTITAHNDIELLHYCATHLKNVSFVLAGQVTGGNYDELARLPNIYLIGKLPYQQIPVLCASFDICLLPWKMNRWIKFCSPLKFFEYLASGKPIVSVPISEIADSYSDIVSIAENKEEYCNAIVRELNNHNHKRIHRRIDVAKKHSWDNHINQLSQIISNAIQTKTAESANINLIPS